MKSMTGYGEATREGRSAAVSVSLRAVNHRFFDLQLRLGDELRRNEAELRDLLAREISRGRVEARVDLRPLAGGEVKVSVHHGVVRAAYDAIQPLVEAGLVERGLAVGDLLRLPEALKVDLGGVAFDEADRPLALETAREALAQLIASREAEGASLARALEERLAALEAIVVRLGGLAPPAREEMAQSLRRRVDELLEGRPVDESRLAQEVALLADRCDVSEELDRLRSHLDHFRAVGGEAGPSGKRLDFLTQEIFRELNTLGAKCRNAEMTRAVLDAKVLCEQLREQVQNVE